MARNHYYTTSRHPLSFRDSIEWEDMPSFTDSLTQRLRPLGADRTPVSAQAHHVPSEAEQFNTAWNVTMPADLVELPTPQPFREALEGLATREVHEPEVFRHFFG